jgi:hypothetical protein
MQGVLSVTREHKVITLKNDSILFLDLFLTEFWDATSTYGRATDVGCQWMTHCEQMRSESPRSHNSAPAPA